MTQKETILGMDRSTFDLHRDQWNGYLENGTSHADWCPKVLETAVRLSWYTFSGMSAAHRELAMRNAWLYWELDQPDMLEATDGNWQGMPGASSWGNFPLPTQEMFKTITDISMMVAAKLSDNSLAVYTIAAGARRAAIAANVLAAHISEEILAMMDEVSRNDTLNIMIKNLGSHEEARIIHTSEREFWSRNSHQLASEVANTGGTKSEDDDNGGGSDDDDGSNNGGSTNDDDNGGDGDDDVGSNNGGNASKRTARLAARFPPKNQSTNSCQLQGNHSKKVTLAPEGGHALPGDGGSKTVSVSGYTRSDGVVVAPHIRAPPASTHSTQGGRQKPRDSSSSTDDAKSNDDDNGGDGDDDVDSNNGDNTSKQTARLVAKSPPKNQSTNSCQLQGNYSKKVTLAPEGGHALPGDGIGSSGDADPGSDPPPCSEGDGNNGDADPGSDPPPCSEGGGNKGDADPGSDPPLCFEGGGNNGDADPGSDPPPCFECDGNNGDADPGSDPPPCSEGDGSNGDADPGSDPPLCSEGGLDSDDTSHGHSIVLTSTGKDPPLSFSPPPPLPPPRPTLLTPAEKCAGA
jgi:hypothetical protein